MLVAAGGADVGWPVGFEACTAVGELARKALVEAVGLTAGALAEPSRSVTDSARKTQLCLAHSWFIFWSPKSRSITKKHVSRSQKAALPLQNVTFAAHKY